MASPIATGAMAGCTGRREVDMLFLGKRAASRGGVDFDVLNLFYTYIAVVSFNDSSRPPSRLYL